MRFFSILLLVLLLTPAALRAQTGPASNDADREAVRQAILDYVEGLYRVQPERIERSVHQDLAKVGFWRPSDTTWYRSTRQDYAMMLRLARTWNTDGHVDARTAPKEIVVFDVMDRTASARLVAEWGIDYLHLAKIDGRWKVINVAWQTRPEGYYKGNKVRVNTGNP